MQLRLTISAMAVCSLLMACAAAQRERPARGGGGAVDGEAVAQAVVDRQKLLCERIWLATSSAPEPDARIDLGHMTSEGGAADVFVRGDRVRIVGQMLACSSRQHFDYRFAHGALVCSRETHTSLSTPMGCDEEGDPAGQGACRPAYWRFTWRVFASGRMVSILFDEAPRGAGGGPADPAATLEIAGRIFELVEAAAGGE